MSFRLLTWNINGTSNQNNGPDQLARAIRRKRIDLAVLQEVSIGGCTLDAALQAELGAGNYTLDHWLANPTQLQRTWNGQVAQAAPDEHYAIITRRSTSTGAYRVTVNGITDPDYVNDPDIADWIDEALPNYRGAGPVTAATPPWKRRRVAPRLVDPNRYHDLGLRRPVRLAATYNGNAYRIFTWHAPQGGGNGGANFSGRDARRGYELWQRWGGGTAYPAARVVLAGDLNARSAGVLGLGEAWAQAVNPGANIHNDAVTHIYGKGVVLTPFLRNTITALAAFSDHVALVADVQ
jgi:endonuclease/exonuclease/phosphatase family metal-dependent hydrolase